MAADRTGDFGRKLRDARERRGISLRQIANATKISVAVLEALERNDVSRLPGGIFSRAFVRSYAIEVGLDPEQTIQEFIAQFPHDSVTVGHAPSEQIDDHETLESDRRMVATFFRLIAVSIPIAGAVLYFGNAGRRATESASGAPAASASTTASAPSVIDRAMSTSPREQPASSAPASAPPPPAETRPPAVRLPAATPATATARVPSGAAAPSDTAALTVAKNVAPIADVDERLTIGLSVTRPCWVSAMVDGQKSIERLLQPGEQPTMEVRRELVLTAGDASAVTMTVNGAEAKPLGKSGEVITARVNRTNFKDYLQLR
jgi:cytoskeletal protein RodZ